MNMTDDGSQFTAYPRSSSSRTQWPAMKPDPPVTRTKVFFEAVVIVVLPSPAQVDSAPSALQVRSASGRERTRP
jgi:hypothetical protein